MEIGLGFLLGLIGSLHCVGMCGPIALALPSGGYPFGLKWTGQIILYNLGRAVTYALMGAVLGLIGSSVAGFGFQNEISIAVGLVMVMMVFFPRVGKYIMTPKAVQIFPDKIKNLFNTLMTRHGFLSLFFIGMINGLLPCGLVYMALAGALAMPDWSTGMAYMFLFGLGTLPALFAVSFFGHLAGTKLREKLVRFAPWFVAFLGIIFILRGMELGIPYLSPKSPPSIEQKKDNLCH